MTRTSVLLLATAFMVAGFPGGGDLYAQAGQPTIEDLAKQIQELKQGQETILKELREMRRQLQTRTPEPAVDPKTVVLDLGERPSHGAADAAFVLVEFSDYQCPFCGRHRREVSPKIDQEFAANGKIRRVFFDMPLESIHPLAFKAAQAARCAGEQGKFAEMQERLFANPQGLEPFAPHAEAVGLDVARFDECLVSGKFAAAVRSDMEQAKKAGVRSTPSFLVAKPEPGAPGKVRGVALIVGAKPFEAFKAELDKALTEQPAAQ